MINLDRNRRRGLKASAVVGLAVILLLGYWSWKGSRGTSPTEKKAPPTTLPRMANFPIKVKKTAPQPSYPPDAPVLQQTRKALRKGITPAEAVALAKALPECPERADAAFLLLDYAAESGNAVAALAMGRYYDPAYGGPSGTIYKNPTIAFEWYQEALAGGQAAADNHLVKLRRWVEKQAAQGSGEARKLLKSWP